MLKDIKRTTRHTTVYAIGNIASKVVGFILLPIYTNEFYLSQADFGTLAVLEATVQVLVAVLSFAMGNSLVRWYWDKNYQTKQKHIVFTSLAFLFLVNVPVMTCLIFKASFFSELLFKSQLFSYLLQLTFATVLFRIFNTFIAQLLQLQSKSVFYSSISIGKLLIVLLLTIVAVTKMGRGLNGIWEASLIGEILAMLTTVPFVLKNIKLKFERAIFKEMFEYSYPLVISNLAVVTLTVMDRYMLHYIAGLAATGIYILGLRLANTLKIVITDSLLSALAPLRMKKMNEPNNKHFFSKILTYSVFLFIMALLVLSLFSLEAIKLITRTPDYWEAAGIIGVLSFAFLFSLMRMNFTIALMITKKTKVLGMLTFLAAALNFILNYFFIPIWDIYGAAAATLLSQLIFMSLTFVMAQKSYFIPYEIGKLVTAILVAALIVYLSIQITNLNLGLRIFIKVGMLVVFPFLLYLFKFYEKVELDNIRRVVSSFRNIKDIKEGLMRLLK